MRITFFNIIAEVDSTYRQYRQKGISRDNTVSKLTEDYHDEIVLGRYDDAHLFWVALADAQYSCKELSEDVAKQGLCALDALENSDLNIAPGDIVRRRKRYQTAPMPERTSFRKIQKFRCQWQLGDTFAYQLSGTDSKDAGIDGKYVLIRKVDEKQLDKDGPIVPVVTFTLWDDQKLPASTKEYIRKPLLKLECGRLGAPETHFEYRALLIVTSKQSINKLQLSYLGNFANVAMPKNEVVFDYPGYMFMVPPMILDRCCSICWLKQKSFECKESSNILDIEPWKYLDHPL